MKQARRFLFIFRLYFDIGLIAILSIYFTQLQIQVLLYTFLGVICYEVGMIVVNCTRYPDFVRYGIISKYVALPYAVASLGLLANVYVMGNVHNKPIMFTAIIMWIKCAYTYFEIYMTVKLEYPDRTFAWIDRADDKQYR